MASLLMSAKIHLFFYTTQRIDLFFRAGGVVDVKKEPKKFLKVKLCVYETISIAFKKLFLRE
jgi:hypothetical protein